MAKYYLINNVVVGTRFKYAGELIDDAFESLTPIRDAGGVLVPSNMTGMTTAAGIAQTLRNNAQSPNTIAAIMMAALMNRTASDSISIALTDWRIVDASGDVGNIAAIGGVLASNSAPILRADAAESMEISWATGAVAPIGIARTLPADFDGTRDVQVELWVYSGATDAASFALETSWDGGALVVDAFDDSATKSATRHRIVATIAAADIPDAARNLSLYLTPPAHAADAFQLLGANILYGSL